MKKSTRRNFIKASGLSVAGASSISLLSSATPFKKGNAPEKLTILFQGLTIHRRAVLEDAVG